MPAYTFLTRPTPGQTQQLTALYRGAGWWPPHDEDPRLLSRIVAGSHCFVAATVGGDIVGMGRVISDGASDAYIQDVTVDARYRGRGIGRTIVAKLVHRLQREGVTWIGLIAENNSQEFYRPLGFTPMPDAAPLLLTLPKEENPDRLPGRTPAERKP